MECIGVRPQIIDEGLELVRILRAGHRSDRVGFLPVARARPVRGVRSLWKEEKARAERIFTQALLRAYHRGTRNDSILDINPRSSGRGAIGFWQRQRDRYQQHQTSIHAGTRLSFALLARFLSTPQKKMQEACLRRLQSLQGLGNLP